MAGDSDSDEEKESSTLPRDLLSPVPTDQATTIVVFGVDGNLATMKLLPTLFHLWRRRLLPRDAIIAGFARPRGAGGRFMDTSEFRAHVRSLIMANDKQNSIADADGFSQCCHFQPGQFGDVGHMRALLNLLDMEEHRREAARSHGLQWVRAYQRRSSPGAIDPDAPAGPSAPGPGMPLSRASSPPSRVRMYYLSVPPFLYSQICAAVVEARGGGGSGGGGGGGGMSDIAWRRTADARRTGRIEERFVLEKPFGRDHATCVELMRSISGVGLSEADTFYIDHYLGKELVMNLLVLRFANVCFGAIWNRQHIKSVQASAMATNAPHSPATPAAFAPRACAGALHPFSRAPASCTPFGLC